MNKVAKVLAFVYLGVALFFLVSVEDNISGFDVSILTATLLIVLSTIEEKKKK